MGNAARTEKTGFSDEWLLSECGTSPDFEKHTIPAARLRVNSAW